MSRLVPDRLRHRWTDAQDRAQEVLLLDLHALSRDRRHLRRPPAPQHLHRRGLRAEPRRDREPPRALGRTRRSTSRTPASPTRRWRRGARARSTCSCRSPTSTRTSTGPREQERFRALALSRLSRIGIPDVERRIRYERVVTPLDWDQGYEIHRGATFNLAHNLGQMLHLRPRNRFEDLDGVYLVGGGTHPGSGLPVIFQSALITARLMMEDLGVQSLPRAARRADARRRAGPGGGELQDEERHPATSALLAIPSRPDGRFPRGAGAPGPPGPWRQRLRTLRALRHRPRGERRGAGPGGRRRRRAAAGGGPLLRGGAARRRLPLPGARGRPACSPPAGWGPRPAGLARAGWRPRCGASRWGSSW